MAFNFRAVLTFVLISSLAHRGYSNIQSHELTSIQGYKYQDPRDQSDNNGVAGIAGEDYPIFYKVPQTRFECEQQQYPGYYADPEADCQVFHICQHGGRKDSFLCPNGTLFNQKRLVCAWWNTVDCSRAQSFYSINEEVAKAMGEADRRLQVAAKGKLSREYQRESNIENASWNKYNQQEEQRGWSKDSAAYNYNQNIDFTTEVTSATSTRFPYDVSEFTSEPFARANNFYRNSYSPKMDNEFTNTEFSKQVRKNDFAEPTNIYLPA